MILYLLLLMTLTLPSFGQEVLSLDDFLKQATQRAEQIQSIEKSIESLQKEIASRDLELTPVLSAGIWDIEDNEAQFTNNVDNRSLSQLFDMELSKPFSSGTTVSLKTEHEIAERRAAGSEQQRADWELTISQALWQNAFGRSVRLRRQSDKAELQSRKYDLLMKRQQALQGLEVTYWDLALSLKEHEIAQSNLERSLEIENWVRKRISRSAAEATDLLQAQALVVARRMDLMEIKNKKKSHWNKIRKVLPGIQPQAWLPDVKSIETDRKLTILALGETSSQPTPQRLDALAAHFRFQQAMIRSQQIADSLNPQLNLELTHGRNGIDAGFSDAWDRAAGSEYTFTQFGLNFTVDLDFSLKEKQRQAASLDAQSHKLLAQKLKRDSAVSWQDLVREKEFLKKQLSLARKLAEFQTKKSAEEHKLYQRGRSTAFQAITFELEAAESQLQVYQLLCELRKTESRARLFRAEGDI